MMKQAWRAVDTKRRGYLQMEELSQLIACVCAELGQREQRLEDMRQKMAQCDADRNGRITREEFEEWYMEFLCKLYFHPRTRENHENEDDGGGPDK
mmetsp:Transcript_83605/g.258543  ORF Transcript_83605/g.258543 Transcript_83605/m.258543 type:complete len:96 (-) Transcript_83605:329-616(-)